LNGHVRDVCPSSTLKPHEKQMFQLLYLLYILEKPGFVFVAALPAWAEAACCPQQKGQCGWVLLPWPLWCACNQRIEYDTILCTCIHDRTPHDNPHAQSERCPPEKPAALGWQVAGWVAPEMCHVPQTIWCVRQALRQISSLPSES
jgi:hypothetical protein